MEPLCPGEIGDPGRSVFTRLRDWVKTDLDAAV
jgi:hypothetical protein